MVIIVSNSLDIKPSYCSMFNIIFKFISKISMAEVDAIFVFYTLTIIL